MNKAVFLDRDGVINRLIERKDGSLTSPWIRSEFSFLPDVAIAIQKLLCDNFKVFVISNQPGIFYGDQDLRELMKMDRILDSLGIHDRIYNLFPNRINEEDYKPGNAAFEKLIKEYDIDRTISYAIGDRWKDIVPANKSGLFSIFLGHTYSCPESMGYGLNSHPNKVCANLLEAVNFIMSNEMNKSKCLSLARHYLTNTVVDVPVSIEQVVKDENSLSKAINEAVEKWFKHNPIGE